MIEIMHLSIPVGLALAPVLLAVVTAGNRAVAKEQKRQEEAQRLQDRLDMEEAAHVMKAMREAEEEKARQSKARAAMPRPYVPPATGQKWHPPRAAGRPSNAIPARQPEKG